jgi:nitrous oxidase accessory protein NosD
MRKLRLTVAALCVVAGALATTAGGARAAIIIVYPGQSIQAAIDAANPGDTIIVKPGTYHETLLIQKDRIKLQGSQATIMPPPVSTSPCGDVGVCVVGNVDFNTGDIFSYVHNVTVTGFYIQGFAEFGIQAYASMNSTFTNDHAANNGYYGITAFTSQGTTIANDVTEGSGEAGIYIGDSPDSRASVHDNFSQHNTFGVLYRNATGGSIQHNTIAHNCAGIVVLGDAPGPAGNVTVQSNQVNGNSAACFSDDAGPISGIGIALVGASYTVVHGNNVQFNVPSDATAFQGGIVVVSGSAGTPSNHNTVTGNTMLHNSPDLFWDGLGHGNVLKPNVCQTSTPGGLCH